MSSHIPELPVPEINKQIFEFCGNLADKVVQMFKANPNQILEFDPTLHKLISDNKNWLDGDRKEIHKLQLKMKDYYDLYNQGKSSILFLTEQKKPQPDTEVIDRFNILNRKKNQNLEILKHNHAGIFYAKGQLKGINYGAIKIVWDSKEKGSFIYFNYEGMKFLGMQPTDDEQRKKLVEKAKEDATGDDITWLLETGYVEKISLDEIDYVSF